MRPKKPLSWNRYSYVTGNPISHFDKHGTEQDCDEDCDCDQGDPNCECDEGDDCFCLYESCGDPGGGGDNPPDLCTISLYERPVFQEIGGIETIVGNHTYIYGTDTFQDGSGIVLNFLCEGGPKNGTLQGGCTSAQNAPVVNGTSGPSLPLNSKVGMTYASADACDSLTQLTVSVGLYKDNGVFAPYNYHAGSGGYNSNSYAFTLLSDIGLGLWFGTPPGIAPGWGIRVPGL
jgi:hypothetical protein